MTHGRPVGVEELAAGGDEVGPLVGGAVGPVRGPVLARERGVDGVESADVPVHDLAQQVEGIAYPPVVGWVAAQRGLVEVDGGDVPA